MINISTEIVKIGKLHKKISNFTSQVIHPETEIAQIVDFPEIYNNNGKFLTTDGSELSWANVDALPLQTGNSGKFLTTNGSSASWATVTAGDTLPTQTNTAGKVLITNGTNAEWASLNSTQEVFDVTSSTESITLTTAPNNTPSAALAVYHDGLRLVNNIDYTYNTSTKVISFNNSFLNGDQVVVYIGPTELMGSSSNTEEYEAGTGISFTQNLVTNKTTISTNIHPSEACTINSSASGSISLNIDTTSVYKFIATGNISFSFTKDSTLSVYTNNRSITLTLLIQNGGSYTIAWPNNVYWPDNTAPSLSTSNKYDIITLITFDSGTTWFGASNTKYTIS